MQGEDLTLDDVAISLEGRELLRVSAKVEPGSVLTVMGPSGSGKSTLLAFIGGFLDPVFDAKGRVRSGTLELTAVPADRRHAGILFQDPLLFPHMSVGANIAFAIPHSVRGKAMRMHLACEALRDIGLEGYEDRDPDTLSGGQKARVALARVLVSEPRCLLLDEPFSKLDTGLRGQMRELVFTRAGERGLPVILVTHDPDDAKAADGQVIHVGT